jgi:hypothetical protein
LHFATLVRAESQNIRFSRNGVDSKQLILVVHYELVLRVCGQPFVLSTQELIPTRLSLLALSARLRGSYRNYGGDCDQNDYDIGSRHSLSPSRTMIAKAKSGAFNVVCSAYGPPQKSTQGTAVGYNRRLSS